MNPKMTPKEAIKVLKSQLHLNCKVTEAMKELEARVIAVEALEKQIPEKLLPEQHYYGIGKCSRCGVVFTDDTTKYCGNCGQAIDWEEGEGDA